ncbi:hypothetical protein DID77_03005, partial [Candidatus Marinamargulisbacteria bacterium SCGC AG-439-L15]
MENLEEAWVLLRKLTNVNSLNGKNLKIYPFRGKEGCIMAAKVSGGGSVPRAANRSSVIGRLSDWILGVRSALNRGGPNRRACMVQNAVKIINARRVLGGTFTEKEAKEQALQITKRGISDISESKRFVEHLKLSLEHDSGAGSFETLCGLSLSSDREKVQLKKDTTLLLDHIHKALEQKSLRPSMGGGSGGYIYPQANPISQVGEVAGASTSPSTIDAVSSCAKPVACDQDKIHAFYQKRMAAQKVQFLGMNSAHRWRVRAQGSKIKRLTAKLTSAENASAELRNVVAMNRDVVSRMTKALGAKEAALKASDTKLSAATAKIDALNQELEAREAVVLKLTEELASGQATIAELETLTAELESLRAGLAAAKTAEATARAELAEAQESEATAKAELAAAKNAEATAKAELAAAQESEAAARADLAAAKNAEAAARAELADLKVSTDKERADWNRVVAFNRDLVIRMAEELKAKKSELLALQSELGEYGRVSSEKIAKMESEITELRAKLTGLQVSSAAQLEELRNSKDAEIVALNERIYLLSAEHQKQLKEIQADFEHAGNDQAAELAGLRLEIERLRSELDAAKSATAAADAKNAALEKQLREKEAELLQAQEAHAKEVAALAASISALIAELDAAGTATAAETAKNATLAQALALKEAELDALRVANGQTNSDLSDECAELRGQIVSLKQQLEGLRQEKASAIE